MVKLADTLDLGSNAVRCAGSSPVIRTSAAHFCFDFIFICGFTLSDFGF